MKRLLLVGLVVLGCARLATAQEHSLTGRVTGVAAGNKFTMLDDKKIVRRVTLSEVEPPEKAQPGSDKARETLSKLIFNKQVRVVWNGEQPKELTANVYMEKRWINRDMAMSGYCWVPTIGNADLVAAHESARKAKAGLFKDDNAESPWAYRLRVAKDKVERDKDDANRQRRYAAYDEAIEKAPERLQRYIKASKASHAYRIKYFPLPQGKTLEQVRAEGPFAHSPILFDPLKVGSIGMVTRVKVVQVNGPKDFLVSIECPHGDDQFWGEPKTVWVSGVDTEGIVDDGSYRLNDLLEVVGTRTYTTTTGASRTVHELKPYDQKPFNAFLERVLEDLKKMP